MCIRDSITGDVGKMLIERGIYTNPILYPAVARKDARIRMAVMATHERSHLDKTLNAFEDINKKLQIARKLEEYVTKRGSRANKR